MGGESVCGREGEVLCEGVHGGRGDVNGWGEGV